MDPILSNGDWFVVLVMVLHLVVLVGILIVLVKLLRQLNG